MTFYAIYDSVNDIWINSYGSKSRTGWDVAPKLFEEKISAERTKKGLDGRWGKQYTKNAKIVRVSLKFEETY